MLANGALKGKDPHITAASALPFYKVKSEGAWGTFFEGTTMFFYNFDTTTVCGAD